LGSSGTSNRKQAARVSGTRERLDARGRAGGAVDPRGFALGWWKRAKKSERGPRGGPGGCKVGCEGVTRDVWEGEAADVPGSVLRA